MKPIYAISGVLVLALGLAGPAHAQDKQLEFLGKATDTVTTLRTDSNMEESLNANLAEAKAVLILPNLIKAGLVLGGEGGTGVVLTRADDGSWGAPAFVEFAGPSLGLQVGGSTSQAVFVAMTDKARDGFSSNSFELGAGAQVAMFTAGGRQEAGFDVYGYALSKGITLGLSVSGSSISVQSAWNEAFYGKDFPVADIVNDPALIDDRSADLRNALSQPAS